MTVGYEAVTLLTLARVESERGNDAIAQKHMESALSIIENTRSKFLNPDLRSSYLASNQDSYQFYIDLLMRMHRQQPTKGYDRTAFTVSERA